MRKAGKVVAEVLQVIETAVKSVITAADLNKAIVDIRLFDISSTVQKYAKCNRYSVVKEYVGHRIERKIQEDP